MIELHREAESDYADEIVARLQNMVVAHRVIADASGTVLVEGSRTYRGRAAIDAFLDVLQRELKMSRQVGGDACYIDPDHPDRCL